jgi:hypothetical protein
MIGKDNLKTNISAVLILLIVPLVLIAQSSPDGSPQVKDQKIATGYDQNDPSSALLDRNRPTSRFIPTNTATPDNSLPDALAPLLENIPDWQKFFTVDQIRAEANKLVKEKPGAVELMELGKSTQGEPIICLKVGDGKYNALIHGFPNSEEPYGGNLLIYPALSL